MQIERNSSCRAVYLWCRGKSTPLGQFLSFASAELSMSTLGVVRVEVKELHNSGLSTSILRYIQYLSIAGSEAKVCLCLGYRSQVDQASDQGARSGTGSSSSSRSRSQGVCGFKDPGRERAQLCWRIAMFIIIKAALVTHTNNIKLMEIFNAVPYQPIFLRRQKLLCLTPILADTGPLRSQSLSA